MKNILLTGSGGFIGKHLKEHLTEYNLFTPRSFQLNLLDKIETAKYLNANNIEFIVHSASCGVRIKPEATMEDVARPNIEMFRNLASTKIPMIIIGSGAEYDKSRPLHKVKEEEFGESVPKDPYGYSKYLISKEIETMENVLNLRLFGIYGFGEDASRVTTCIINDYINKRPISLYQNVIYDFIWIDDFCKIVKHFVDNPTKEKFINISPTQSIETLKLAQIVNEFSDYKCPVTFKKEGYNLEYTGDNTLLLEHIHEFHFTSYADGMKILYNQIKEKGV